MGFWPTSLPLGNLQSLVPTWLKPQNAANVRFLLYGIFLGFSFSLTATSFVIYHREKRQREVASSFQSRPIELRSDEIAQGLTGLIGNTPLIRINSLSDALGVNILGKAEFLNPGGSVKDRVALRIIEDAERQGLLHPHTGSRIFEGTVGSTGISIATIAKARPRVWVAIIMPDDIAVEKVNALRCLGATVERVRPASIVDTKHNVARQYAANFSTNDAKDPLSHHLVQSTESVLVTTTVNLLPPRGDGVGRSGDIVDPEFEPRGFFADQFENRSNFDAHFEGTGPEIWRQTNGMVDAFVAGAGTGGTISGIGGFLKSVKEDVKILLADPEGSGLYNKVKHGVMFDRREAEGTKRRHQVDTVVEGIGINRVVKNFERALPIIDDAFRITDPEAVGMARFLVENDGLFVGSSSACNLVAAVRYVRKMGWKDGQNVVTILCDSGNRHYSKFWNDEYLRNAGISIDTQIITDMLH
ncbi:tryptophan synthase beta subunit-like PLP-dependent enzyme [Thelephora terrestris]|uniref:cysteine synthase n=1 Tax=Thelephora terrestris TaxID=56493 RepID=A0A9P6LBA9_9AGAM|nr:tryptophan synthase beta subunit-like PLP-dependent enzyme [Thelephora terrestris]